MDAPRIPDTDAYTAMGSYKALTSAASGPTGVERMLGEINRDGTTAHIPYLTTYEGYNQRIVLSNRKQHSCRLRNGVQAGGGRDGNRDGHGHGHTDGAIPP